jgi:VWFA-related protein
MKSGFIVFWIVVFLAALPSLPTARAQPFRQQPADQKSKDDELPSAPSAVVIEQNKQSKPKTPQQPQQPPVEQQPAASGAQSTAPPVNQAVPQAAEAQPVPSSSTTNAPAPATAPGPVAPSRNANASITPNEDLTTIRVPVNEVSVIFTVTDKHNHFVKNLTRNDFKVLDDKKPQPTLTFFRSETELPLRVGLLIDASNSVRDRFKFEQEAAIEFLNQIVRPRFDSAFVVGFDVTSEVTQDFTDNTELLSYGVHMLRPGGGTALYDAVYYSCREKLAKAAPETMAVRRAIILLSDGEDNQSHVTREEAIEMAQRAEVIVYPISTNISGVKMHGDRVLERIADATGGRAFFPFRAEQVANAFTEIKDELRSQYALAYRPASFQKDGRYHSIEILAQNRKDLHVRSRHGYFAPTR